MTTTVLNSTTASALISAESEDDGRSVDQTSIELSTFTSSIFLTAFCIFGLYGNLISAVIFLHPIMRSPINILLGALSIIDLVLVCLVVFVFIIPAYNIFIDSPHIRALYPFTLLIIYPCNMVAQSCSVWTFVLVSPPIPLFQLSINEAVSFQISVERFAAVCRPLMRHKLLTCSQARLAETMIVIFAICYNVVRFFEYEAAPTPTGFRRLLRNNTFYYVFYHTVLYVLTHFFVPFFIILVLNACILRSLRQSHRRREQMSRQQLQQRRTSAMIVTVTLMFAFCNTAPFLLGIWEALEPDLFHGSRMKTAYILLDVSNLLIVLNSSTTAIIYWIYCKKYRRLFRHFSSFACLKADNRRRLSHINADHFGKALISAHLPAAAPLLVYEPLKS